MYHVNVHVDVAQKTFMAVLRATREFLECARQKLSDGLIQLIGYRNHKLYFNAIASIALINHQSPTTIPLHLHRERA